MSVKTVSVRALRESASNKDYNYEVEQALIRLKNKYLIPNFDGSRYAKQG